MTKELNHNELPSECQSKQDGVCSYPIGTCKQCNKYDNVELLKAHIKNLEQDRDEKEIIIGAFSKVCEMFESRSWLMQGRGNYPYNDDRYKQEVRYLMDEFNLLKTDTWRNIKTKSFDYKQVIIKNYESDLQTITKQLEAGVEDLRKKLESSMKDSAMVILDHKNRIKELEGALKETNDALIFMNDTVKSYKVPFTVKDDLIKSNEDLLNK